MQTFTIAVSDEVLSDLRSRLIDKLRDRADCQGDLESRFNRDELCTIATLYWVTDSIGTSFRQDFDLPHNAKRPRITVPVAVTQSQEWNMPLFPGRSRNGPRAISAGTWPLIAVGTAWLSRNRNSSPRNSPRS